MKNIAIVDYNMSVTGGAEQVAANLANGLSRYYQVHIISALPGTKKIPYNLDERVIFTSMLKEEKRLRNCIAEFRKPFRKYLKEQNIEVVLLVGDYAGMIALPARFGTKAKYIFCEHGALMNQWTEKDIRFIRRFCSMFADKVITLTKSSRDSYIKKFHVKKTKVGHIYNWIEPAVTENTGTYHSNFKKILSVGRFGKEKGQDLLLQVAKKVLPAHEDWQWHVYGDGETFDAIQELVKVNHLENQLILKGNDREIQSKYCQYGIFVLTSYREGLPLVLLEAKANHLPMISFDILTGPAEIICDHEDGYLIPMYSVDMMAEKLAYLMEHEGERIRYSQNTYHGMDKFQMEVILRQWRRLIEEMRIHQ